MTTSARLSASDLAAQTPASRDRYVDFLRLASIGVVVLGHWLMAVVVWHGSTFRVGNVVGMTPGLWLATWALQVMPIFFFVGGFANAVTLDALERKGQGGVEFVAGRVARLLRPVAVLLAVWVPSALALEWAGLDPRVLRAATRLVCQPLWFIGVYLAVTALAPAMRSLHRAGARQTVAGLAVTVVLVDVVRFGGGVVAAGWVNVVVVWLLAQQLGFFYADGSLLRARRSHLAGAAVGAIALLGALTTFGPYPRSMVGLPGDRVSNMSPPTVCLAVLLVFQVALVMLCRDAAQRWLARRSVWTAVVAGNGVIMTVFLWHLTAALIAVAAMHVLGVPQPAGASAAWWLSRPLWIALAALPLAGLVARFARYERPRRESYTARGPAAGLAAGTGVALLAVAVLGVAASNLADLVANTPVQLAIVRVTPVELLLAGAAGLALVRKAVEHQDFAKALGTQTRRA